MDNPLVLLVSANRGELETLSSELGEEGYATVAAASLEELDGAIKKQEDIQLALLDIAGFDKGIWERCGRLHGAKIPFIVIAPQRSPAVQRESLKHGASGLLVKPLGIKELLEHIYTLTW